MPGVDDAEIVRLSQSDVEGKVEEDKQRGDGEVDDWDAGFAERCKDGLECDEEEFKFGVDNAIHPAIGDVAVLMRLPGLRGYV